jgi:hypothetical protein
MEEFNKLMNSLEDFYHRNSFNVNRILNPEGMPVSLAKVGQGKDTFSACLRVSAVNLILNHKLSALSLELFLAPSALL